MGNSTGVNTSTIIYVRHRAKPPRGKNCSKCKSWNKGYCNEFKIRITDNTNAKICSKYNESGKSKVKKLLLKIKRKKLINPKFF